MHVFEHIVFVCLLSNITAKCKKYFFISNEVKVTIHRKINKIYKKIGKTNSRLNFFISTG